MTGFTPLPSEALAVSPTDVLRAAERLAGHLRPTPLIENEDLDRLLGGRVLLKVESMQPAGSFKIRGALNALLALEPAVRANGVVAFSSGNHGRAVAVAARRLGTSAVVVMPSDAPEAKIEGTRSAGAEVVLYRRGVDDREAIGLEIARSRNLTLVPPFDDADVIAGQGMVALETIAQARALGVEIDALVVPCSGGGLAAGCALGLRQAGSRAEIITVEPSGFDDMARSLHSGRIETNSAASGSICDALLVQRPGALTLPILRACGATGVSVEEGMIRRAVSFCARELRLVIEPGGCVALAAALSRQVSTEGRIVAIVLSGGNVDNALLSELLQRASVDGR